VKVIEGQLNKMRGIAPEKIAEFFCVDCPRTSSAQEIHQAAYHIICDLVEEGG